MKSVLLKRQVRDNLIIVILFGALILVHKTVNSWHMLHYDLEQQATALILTLKPTLQFQDRKEAFQTLGILQKHDHIVGALVTAPSDPEFAFYYDKNRHSTLAPQAGFTWNSFTEQFPILDEGEKIGTLILERHLVDIYQGIFVNTLIVLIMGLLVWLASFLFARSVHETFSASFRQMIDTMKQLKDSPQYFERLAPSHDDTFEEIHFILQQFQLMTEALYERDQRLVATNSGLEIKVLERTQELKLLQERMVDEAHKAGMADVASSILHNFGNILNSISIDCSMLREMVLGVEQYTSLRKVMEILSNQETIKEILASHSKTDSLLNLFREIDRLGSEDRNRFQEITGRMNQQLYLMKDLIYYQQNYATGQSNFQNVAVKEILELAFNIKLSMLKNSNVLYSIEVEENCIVAVQKTKILHVFANLIVNSVDAMKGIEQENRMIQVWTKRKNDVLEIHVRDFGYGIPRDKVTKIFNLGFTTKETGHGFGLHSSANYMREMNGSLELEDPQPNVGASFILRVKIAGEKNSTARPDH